MPEPTISVEQAAELLGATLPDAPETLEETVAQLERKLNDVADAAGVVLYWLRHRARELREDVHPESDRT